MSYGHIQFAEFSPSANAKEAFLILESKPCSDIKKSCEHLNELLDKALKDKGLSLDYLVFSRIFFSDIENQKYELLKSQLYTKIRQGAFSFVGQSPLLSGQMAVMMNFISPPEGKKFQKNIKNIDILNNSIIIKGKNYSIIWNANHHGKSGDSAAQTDEIFSKLCDALKNHDITMNQNSLRSWIYVRDIDNNYQAMAHKRKSIFDSLGLSERTRYLASTGIEGQGYYPHTLVSIDLLSYSGMKQEQIERMDALGNMPRTIDYGITFERGLKVKFGDRSQLFISGTASIDEKGEILHSQNIERQTERMLDNIEALLNNYGGKFGDMLYFVCYLRDIYHTNEVNRIISERIPKDIPRLFLWAPVCRPGWLIEGESYAVIKEKSEFPHFL